MSQGMSYATAPDVACAARIATSSAPAASFDPASWVSPEGVGLDAWRSAQSTRGITNAVPRVLRRYAIGLRTAWAAAIGRGVLPALSRLLGVHRATLARWSEEIASGAPLDELPAAWAWHLCDPADPAGLLPPPAPGADSCAARREASAIRRVYGELEGLDCDGRRRVISLAADRYLAAADGAGAGAGAGGGPGAASGATSGASSTHGYAHGESAAHEPPGWSLDSDSVEAARRVATWLGSTPELMAYDPRRGGLRLELWQDGGETKPACDLVCVRAGGAGACLAARACDALVRAHGPRPAR